MSHNFHITPEDGIARPCSGNCRYGDNVISGDTAEEAQRNYAISKGLDNSPTLKKGKFISNETIATEKNIGKIISEYNLDFGNSEVFEQNNEIFVVVEAPQHSTIQLELNKGDDIGELRSLLADRFNEHDATEVFDELWSKEFGDHNGFEASDFYENLQEDELYFRELANRIEFEGEHGKPYQGSTENEKFVESERIDEALSTSYSEISNTDEVSVDNVEQLIEDYELDYGNAESFEQGDEVYITMEAPDNATMGISVRKNASISETRLQMIDHMNDFSAASEFSEIWSEDFGNHNGFSAPEFMKKLQSDESYFKHTARKIQQDINNL